MLDYNNMEQPIVNEDIFTALIKKETWFKSIFLNAIYLKNSTAAIHWSYYIYFYSKKLNICYINDLNFYGSVERLSVTNTIEQLSSKILSHIKILQGKNKKFKVPKFIYFHTHWYWSTSIVRQKIYLQSLYDKDKELVWFGKPDWTAWNEIIFPESIEDKYKG